MTDQQSQTDLQAVVVHETGESEKVIAALEAMLSGLPLWATDPEEYERHLERTQPAYFHAEGGTA
ncbi:hypothetical protein [uncultured Enterovirga sp.]|uniref:hypothetical protein n=1 Tax=uncultured Enterovirga sp. TaxID=2026352 RepID=UPI0035CA230F